MVNKFLNSIYFPKTYVVEPEFHSPARKNVKTKTITYEAEGRELHNIEKAKTKEMEERGEDVPIYRRVELTKKERTVTRDIEYINLYPKNLKIEFKPGINLIVGENGCGKSTLLRILNNYLRIGYVSEEDRRVAEIFNSEVEEKKPDGVLIDNWDREVHIDTQNLSLENFCGWDFEKDNPAHNEKLKPVSGEIGKVVGQKMAFLWSIEQESHGESNRNSLDMFMDSEGRLIIFDEPESAISLQGQYEYWNKLRKLAEHNQILLITHSKVFMEEAGEVFDMEKKKWIETEEYFKKIKKKFK